ncbi:hypothetical protein AVEN_74957-1 [Araneus ventricosus]|uniref:Uncharacterized protein n=1 Tax=Araneus ventricosus TaxID=182803 RepID=A0A4Y2T0X3_ARAVE|nr:hypothetical protein AVEN_74957-1 [Araneus ventricosus]
MKSDDCRYHSFKQHHIFQKHGILCALLYGAGVWGGSLNTENNKRLTTIQRMFLLKFMKVYRATSTQVLSVLAGIPPLYLSAKAEFQKFKGLPFLKDRSCSGCR